MPLSRKKKSPFKLISQLFTEGGRPRKIVARRKADADEAREKKLAEKRTTTRGCAKNSALESQTSAQKTGR